MNIPKLPWLIALSLTLALAFMIHAWPTEIEEVRTGTLHITLEQFARQLEDVSTRKGIEKITRKEVKPVSHAVSTGGATAYVERFVAAARDTGELVKPSVAAETSGDSVRIPAQPQDTVCMGLGGSQRRNELKLISACVPGNDGVIDRYRGRSFDWTYVDGKPKVSVARGPDVVQAIKYALVALLAWFAGMHL